MGKKKKRGAEDESSSSSSSSSSSDDIFTEETAYRKRRSEARRINRKKEGKVIGILMELKEEMCKQSKKFSESKDDTSEIRKLLEKLTENHNDQSKRLEKLTESYNDLRKQLELHTNKGTSGDDSAASRSPSHHVQQPRYRLEFTSGVIDKIEKGQSIEISVALVDCNNNQTVENGPLASATVELVVVNSEFNQHDNQYNWSREEFERNVKKARQANSATEDVDQSVKSIVSNGRFNLIHGVKCHSGSKIFSNSSNKKVRLGVMVVSPTEERVLEGLSNPFFVRGHDRPNRQCRLPDSRSNRQGLHNGYQEQNGPMPYMQNPSWANSVQAIDEPLESDYFMGMNAVESNLFRTPGNKSRKMSIFKKRKGRSKVESARDWSDLHTTSADSAKMSIRQVACAVGNR